MVLLPCTSWRKDRGEGVHFALEDFGGGWIFGVCKFQSSFVYFTEVAAVVTNLLKLFTFSTRDS